MIFTNYGANIIIIDGQLEKMLSNLKIGLNRLLIFPAALIWCQTNCPIPEFPNAKMQKNCPEKISYSKKTHSEKILENTLYIEFYSSTFQFLCRIEQSRSSYRRTG